MPIDTLTPSELEFLARELLRLQKGYIWAKTAAEVPEACGSYILYRRLRPGGGGVCHCLREAFPGQPGAMWGIETDQIFFYRLDDDGSVARWLDHGPEPEPDEEEDVPGFCTKCGAPG